MTDFIAKARHLIEVERRRQIEAEGWDTAHDDRHDNGELLRAGVLYMNWDTEYAPSLREDGAPTGWPWDARWWKPRDRKRNLERAGALMLAEKERLGRIPWREHSGITRVADQIHPVSIYRTGVGKPTNHVDQKLDLCICALAVVLEAAE
jgi:hypothetical protein